MLATGSARAARRVASEPTDPTLQVREGEMVVIGIQNQPGTTLMTISDLSAVDAEVKVSERRPWTVFGLFNNAGSPQNGRSRMSVGGQHSNLFGMDHVLTATASSSPQDFRGVRQYGLSYEAPLYALSGWATLSWVRSEVDSGTVEQFESFPRGRRRPARQAGPEVMGSSSGGYWCPAAIMLWWHPSDGGW